jgi:hypothetical protein
VQVLQTLMDGYADRPPLGMRAGEVAADPATGRVVWRLLPVFETTSYGELCAEVKAVAAVWSSDEVPVGAVTSWPVLASPVPTIYEWTSPSRTWAWCRCRCNTISRCTSTKH